VARRVPSIGAWVLGIATALFPVAIAVHFHPDLPLIIILPLYGFSTLVLAFAWRVYFERPKELDKKIPISSKELRRRKKEFYDSLPR
jgi:4-hydroxybenzoate polyprenyltransferase